MNIKPIRNDEDLRSAFKQLDLVFQAQEGTPEADEMEVYIGPSGRDSEVLNRKRRLSLFMIKRLHQGLHIQCESLLTAG